MTTRARAPDLASGVQRGEVSSNRHTGGLALPLQLAYRYDTSLLEQLQDACASLGPNHTRSLLARPSRRTR